MPEEQRKKKDLSLGKALMLHRDPWGTHRTKGHTLTNSKGELLFVALPGGRETGAGQPEVKGKGPLQSQYQGPYFPPSTEQAANRSPRLPGVLDGSYLPAVS